jgi:hypothetical protein
MGKSPSHKKENVAVPKWAVQQDRFSKGKKYPACKGTFPDCPVEISAEIVADQCRSCPFFK